MDVLDLMDALQVHALAAATAAATASSTTAGYDVAVGRPVAKGRSVRVFYGGEREVEHFADDKTLNSQLVATVIGIQALWPHSETAAKRQRIVEQEMGVFVKELRTRVLGDTQLGGEASDSNLGMASVGLVVEAQTQYTAVNFEYVADYDEYTIAP